MHLLVSVALLFILLTGGYSLKCYECNGQTGPCGQVTCPSGFPKCSSSKIGYYNGSSKQEITFKACAISEMCTPNINMSVNFGILKTIYSTQCCDTDLCNVGDAPDLNAPNGKTCYTCNLLGCSEILECSGIEDRCITVQQTYGKQLMTVKGCVSKSFCDLSSNSTVQQSMNRTCCEKNLCNGAKSVTQSFLLLLCPLLTFFLFQ